jgi:hypothetical protein
MKSFKSILSEGEKKQLKQKRVKISELNGFDADEIAVLMNVGLQRGREIAASIDFQTIPSIGPKFAGDLISLGYYHIDDLLDKNGPALFDELELKQGFWTDPCVEDQFWLAVHYANNRDSNKQWWDFTAARKTYRSQYGYPAGRPITAWHELIEATAG